MRILWRGLLSSPKRKWQLLSLFILFVLMNLMSTLVYKSSFPVNNKKQSPITTSNEQLGNNLHFPDSSQQQTVSYNEILPEGLYESQSPSLPKLEEVVIEDYFEEETSSSSKVPNIDILQTFPVLDNPWFSHDHDESSGVQKDPLGLSPEDFEYESISENCKIRSFKNISVFSQAEFIHEYIDFRQCYIKDNPKAGVLDQWIKSNLKASTGSMGQMVIQSKFKLTQDLPGICEDFNPILLVVAFSNSKAERDNVRATWGQTILRSHKHLLVFLLGKQQTIERDLDLSSEIEEYKDILQSDISTQDKAYEVKQILVMLSWVYQNCPLARFVVRTTSDTFINVPKIETLATQEMFAANRMYGELLKRMEPTRASRDDAKKTTLGHLVAKEDWPWAIYPPFLKGPSFVISGDVIPRLLMASTVIPSLPLAQVFFTGLAPLMGHLMRIGVASFFAYSPPDSESKDPCDYSKFGAIHQMTQLEQMQKALDMGEEAELRNVTCPVGPRCLAMVEGKCMMFSKEEKDKRKKKKVKPHQKWA